MKQRHLYIWVFFAIVAPASCSIQEEDYSPAQIGQEVFYASFEQPSDNETTRLFADRNLYLRWTADDRISIFNRITYNQQYRFLGETGDNAGEYTKVESAEFVTGNPIKDVVSVYPYLAGTKISESEIITVNLPSEQLYAVNSFGLNSNTMVSVSSDNILQYKNVGGYLRIDLYGEGISVSTITLKGNNGEKLAGRATVTMPLDGEPKVEMAADAITEVTLASHNPVVLGSSSDAPTTFWFVLPPVSFENGFTIVVRRKDGTAFTKTTHNRITITRNHISDMSPFQVEMEGTQPNNIIYYTSTDGAIVKPSIPSWGGADVVPVSNSYENGVGVLSFNSDVKKIPNGFFEDCFNLATIKLPLSLTDINYAAFYRCTNLSSIVVPEGVTSIGSSAFYGCSNLTSIELPAGVTSIGDHTFNGCSSLTSIVIPEGVTNIGDHTFNGCSSLTSIVIPEGVTSIGNYAFGGCSSLESIKVIPTVPPSGGVMMFHQTGLCPIYIPAGSENAYANADFWKSYALRMRVEGSDTSLAYSSSDYSQDGEVVQLQKATVGRGINIVFLGDGYLDQDMGPGGKYEQKMNEAMEQFFAYEPYYSFRNRFNIFYVKVVSKNDIYGDDIAERRLSYEKNGSFYFRLDVSREYWEKVPNPFRQPMKVCTLFNTQIRLGRSWCWWLGNEDVSAFVMDRVGPVLNHEIGGHGFGLLWDEYVENETAFSDREGLDNSYSSGYGANVDWRSNPKEVRWSRFLQDSRYSREGLGIYEGGYLYAHGIYRATENSMMRYNDTPFNAPSREQIYKFIMKYSEGENWVYDYEEFVKADTRGRMEAAEELGPSKKSRRSNTPEVHKEEFRCQPVEIDKTVRAVGVNPDGKVTLVY